MTALSAPAPLSIIRSASQSRRCDPQCGLTGHRRFRRLQFQSGNIVYGLEGELGYRFRKGHFHDVPGPGNLDESLGLFGSVKGPSRRGYGWLPPLPDGRRHRIPVKDQRDRLCGTEFGQRCRAQVRTASEI